LPRKTDANNPADWLLIATADMEMLRLASANEIAFITVRSKLAEVLEKVIKAELIRLGWKLVKTHDLVFLAKELRARNSDLVDAVHPLVTELAEADMQDRYPGFDPDDPDWPALREEIKQVESLLAVVQARVTPA
jgi:HEPN domain-containing protein